MSREVAERLRRRRTAQKVETEDGDIYVRGLTGTERKDYLQRFRQVDGSTMEVLIADQWLVALAVCESDGGPAYSEFNEALAAVCDWPIDTASKVAKKVLELSGMERNALEEAEKNS